MPASPPLAALLLATAAVAAVLLASSASPAAAAAVHHGGGRMVIIRAAGTRVIVSAPGARRSTRHDRRLVEDEVAPEFVGGLLGAGDGGHISYETLRNDRPACGDSCAAKGDAYTGRHCKYRDHCRG